MFLEPEVAEYSTVEPVFSVGVETLASSPVSLRIAELLNAPVTERLLPFRSRVPEEIVRAPATDKG